MYDKHETPKMKSALDVFEKRNKAFRILYDTVLQVTNDTDIQRFAILCRNLKEICNAELAVIASYFCDTKTVIIEAISTNEQDFYLYNNRKDCDTTPVSDDFIEIYNRATVQECVDGFCLNEMFPNSTLSMVCGHGSKRCYMLSAKCENELVAVGMVRMPKGQLLKMKDMVDTYLGLVGVIMHRSNIVKALQTSNQRFKTLIDSSPVGIMLVNEQKIVMEINNAGLDLIGREMEEVIGKTCFDVVCPIKDRICPIYDEGHEAEKVERMLKHSDGTLIPVIKSVARIEMEGSKYLIETFMDLSKLKQTEDDRNHLEEELTHIRKLESIGVLAGGIAHDFNNFLTCIIGNLHLVLLELPKDSKLSSLLSDAEKASVQAKNLSLQLLTFSKGGAPIRETVFLEHLLCASIKFALKGSNVKPIFHIPKDLYAVNIDEGQISQVFSNLVINAKQAMPEGGVIEIICENIEFGKKFDKRLAKGKYLKITVKDEGMGISKYNMTKIFDPYFSTKDKGSDKGSGLGLSIVFSIIKKHGGHITVESEEGKGTTFSLFIPALYKERIVEKKKEVKLISGEGRIMVMDDDEIVLTVVSNMLEHLGYEVATALDGDEAIALYIKSLEEGSPFDIVIMDLTIPGGKGGKNTIKRLLKIDPDAKAIVSSGYSNDPIMANCKKFGFSGVVSKPVDIKILGRTLHELIKGDQ